MKMQCRLALLVLSSFPASALHAQAPAGQPTPAIHLDIDRDKVQVLGIKLSDVFQVLQTLLGSFYVNDMNLLGSRWQVQVQAEAAYRASVDDIYRINVRTADGKMVPLRSLFEVRVVIGPQAPVRYNNRLALGIQGSPAPGITRSQYLAHFQLFDRVDRPLSAKSLRAIRPFPCRENVPRSGRLTIGPMLWIGRPLCGSFAHGDKCVRHAARMRRRWASFETVTNDIHDAIGS